MIGRTCAVDGVTWLAQSGSAVEFVAVARRVAIELAGDESAENEKDLQPRFAVLVDGEVVVDETLGTRDLRIDAFDGEADRRAVVEIVLLSEAKRGAVGVRSVTVDAGEAATVVPTESKELSIEFIGDSITCGYGVEAAGVDEPFRTTEENFMKSYAYLAAQKLGADYSAVCYSGYGVVSGWSADGARKADMLVPPLYGKVAAGFDTTWNHAAHAYDVVVINLGTNDFAYTGTDKARMDEFAAGYVRFLAQVRAAHPESHIVCTMGTMGCHELYPYLEQAVHEFSSNTGDERTVCYLSVAADVYADGAGTSGHPSAITQQKSAAALVDVISSL